MYPEFLQIIKFKWQHFSPFVEKEKEVPKATEPVAEKSQDEFGDDMSDLFPEKWVLLLLVFGTCWLTMTILEIKRVKERTLLK